jgi:hypothetical protein
MSMFTPRGEGGHSPVRRGRRRRVTPLLVVLVVVAAVGAGYYWVTVRDGATTAADPSPTRSCPAPSPLPSVVPANRVRVNVYNATDRRGLAATVATQLRRRGFVVGKVDNDPAKRTVTGVAEVRSSTTGAGAARTVGAQVGTFVTVPDQRPDASVDLVLGAGFRGLRSPQQAAAAASPTPSPRPAGC